jgi:excisionase family DNA binding protein
MEQHLLSAREAAAYLGCSEAGVRRWVARGRLRGVRVGRALRIARSDLDAIVVRGGLDRPVAGDEDNTPARSPLPWTLRAAARYLAELGGDIEVARAALDLIETRS